MSILDRSVGSFGRKVDRVGQHSGDGYSSDEDFEEDSRAAPQSEELEHEQGRQMKDKCVSVLFLFHPVYSKGTSSWVYHVSDPARVTNYQVVFSVAASSGSCKFAIVDWQNGGMLELALLLDRSPYARPLLICCIWHGR